MKKAILIIIVILLGALVIFHFIAANQAEKQIDKTIQMQADSVGYSVQYSSIQVAPFRGNITFEGLTLIRNQTIERAQKMELDLSYIDFLNIYFGGFEYGLQQLTSATLNASDVSWLSRNNRKQVSLGDMQLHYDGNMWDGLRAAYFKKPLRTQQKIDLRGAKFHYRKEQSSVGNFKSDSVFMHFTWQTEGTSGTVTDSLRFRHTTWTPPASFQQKYAFFIQGFGFKQDSIPIPAAGLSSSLHHNKRLEVKHGRLKTKLFTIQFDGNIVKDSAWAEARLSPMNIVLQDLSPQFKKVLSNIKQLLDITLPEQAGGIHFQLVGPLAEPRMKRNRAVPPSK